MKQETRGEIGQLKGRGKKLVGIVPGDSSLEREGNWQQAMGEAEESLGKAQQEASQLLSKAAKKIDD